jgi:hypothetical protein
MKVTKPTVRLKQQAFQLLARLSNYDGIQEQQK